MSRRGQCGGTKETAPKGAAGEPHAATGTAEGRARKPPTKAAPAVRAAAARTGEVPPEQRAFAANLTRLRLAAGLTQDELSARSGVSQSNISALEKGTWEPRLSTILALAKAFGVAPAALLPGWDGA